MRAELLEDAAVRPLGHQVKVELAEERREAVGVLDVPRRVAEARAQPIGEGLLPLRDGAGEKALVVQAAQLGHRPSRLAVRHLHRAVTGDEDRKIVVSGKRVSVGVYLGGTRRMQKK